MLPVINRILDCYTRETGAIQMDDTDQLVVVRDHSTQPDPAGSAAPRGGKPVEIQALFYNALRIASDLNTLEGNNDKAEHFDALSLKTARSINERYFKQGEVYPYDVLDGGETVKHDVRPHALLLISLSETGGLLSDAKKELIIDTVEKRLLTPYGLRSLAPENENYSSGSETGAALKVANSLDGQGSVWPYYFSPYFQAKVKVALGQGHSRYSRIKGELKNHINNLLYMAKEGPLPEVFSGSAPYTPGFSQGSSIYSVSSLIECMALLNSEFPLQGYSIASRQNVRLENLVKILASF
jgi:glycogen debranching enzyme